MSDSTTVHETAGRGRAGSATGMRRMMLADLEAVVRIEREIYPFPWTPGNFRDSLRAGYQCWVMTGDGDRSCRRGLIGYCVMMQVLDEAHLMNLSIDARLQRRGYGRRLLGWLMDSALARGAHGVYLEVRPSNQAALALYRRAGFERIGLRRNYYPNGEQGREDAVVMRCDLRDPAQQSLSSCAGSDGRAAANASSGGTLRPMPPVA